MLTNLFENLVIQFVQDNLERIMRAETTTSEPCTRNTAILRNCRFHEIATVSSKPKCSNRISAVMAGWRKP